jgi:tripartite-type tricarboxylate transporter receptor subunit TctC
MKRVLTALLIAACAAVPAHAQDWPAKGVKLIVPFAAGATPDIVGRMLAEDVQAKFRQPVVVENKPGASGNTGTDAVAKAEPDGYTLGISIGGPLAINTLLFSKLPYDPGKDLSFITMLATQPSALAVNAGLKVENVRELIALLKANPGKYNFGSIGNGSLSHLSMEAIAFKSGTQMTHIPYPSSPQAVTALIRGDVQVACLPAIAITPQLASGQIKLLAISTAARDALLPGVPTLKEEGVDVEADAWMGLIAPAKTPAAAIDQIQKIFASAITTPAIREKLATQLMSPIPTTPAQFRARIEADIARWMPVIKAADIKIN